MFWLRRDVDQSAILGYRCMFIYIYIYIHIIWIHRDVGRPALYRVIDAIEIKSGRINRYNVVAVFKVRVRVRVRVSIKNDNI